MSAGVIIGVDPGKATAWTALHVEDGRPAVVSAFGVLDFDDDETPEEWAMGPAREWLSDRCWVTEQILARDTLVAVETPSRVHLRAASGGITPSMASGLLFVKGIAVALASAVASLDGVSFAYCDAATWRKRVVGRPNASDAQVKAALERAVRAKQLAELPRTNCHVRDAIGVALWAADMRRRLCRADRSPYP
jgi:hypothetical protein